MVSREEIKEVVEQLRQKADQIEEEKSSFFVTPKVTDSARVEAYRDAADLVEETLLD